ncbi:spore germination protein [Bacillus thermotolerans]|uniref:spore germination protein n=1 Tax=Bacillus thermotolerans TaxID=1221996 RepID=UPI0005836BF5|nr:spore germination protein [Bacillus thermotolerans]KKB34201.1 Spore germination protein GerKA [Bacillus thermotolerans]
MIRNVSKLLKHTKGQKSKKEEINQAASKPQDPLYPNFNDNVEALRSIYKDCSDVIFRSFSLFGKTRAIVIYMEGLSDVQSLEEYVFTPLTKESTDPPSSLSDFLVHQLPVAKVTKIHLLADCIESISTGNPVLLCEGQSSAFSLGLAKSENRSIEEPMAESSIKGPRQGFIESLQVNISLLRKIIKTPAFKMRSLKIGTHTQTTVTLAYIEGLADPTLIEEAQNRLNGIDIDGVLESEYIEELIEDNPYSPFPQILSTERPDVVCANLLEGRIAILVDGTPFTLIAPVSFASLLQSQEDFYQRSIISTMIRWMRFFFLGVALLFPALYVAVTTFHQEMLPTALLLSIASSRENVPFPAIVEVLIMEIAFEALREAGIRLPRQIGSAVSIVGALVIGQASVEAGLVSAPMVIVVALTGVASFMMPRYITGISIRMLRFPLIILGGTLGLLGVVMGFIAIVIHLCTLRSFGEPYLAPVAPLQTKELKDFLWRSPLWMMNRRPHLTGDYNEHRQSSHLSPNPKAGGEAKNRQE